MLPRKVMMVSLLYYGLILLQTDFVSSQSYAPLCQNETKLYIQWEKPASGWYYYDNLRESYLKRPPSSDGGSYDSFYEFFKSFDGYWKLQEYDEYSFFYLKSIPFNGSNPFLANEYPSNSGNLNEVRIKDVYEHFNETGTEFYESEEIPPAYGTNKTFDQSTFRVTCPSTCSCEMINIYGISAEPIQLFRTDIARFWEYNCSSVLAFYNIPEVPLEYTAIVGDDYHQSWWKPEAYLSKECQILYYNAEYDTWHADLMPSYPCSLMEFFSSDSSSCIEGLPLPKYQKWDTYAQVEDSQSTIVQHRCDQTFTIQQYKSFSVSCGCRCKRVKALVIDHKSAKLLIFKRSDLFNTDGNHLNDCSAEIENFNKRNNVTISTKFATSRSRNWKLDYYISRDCHLLYQNIYDNSWIMEFYSTSECKSTRFVSKHKSKCVENLPPPIDQNWRYNHRNINWSLNNCKHRSTRLELLAISCADLEF